MDTDRIMKSCYQAVFVAGEGTMVGSRHAPRLSKLPLQHAPPSKKKLNILKLTEI